jgi:AraC-like DNA-binding protein
MRGASVATTSSRALLQACERLGLDTGALLGAAQLTRAELDDPDGRLPGESVSLLWREAIQRSGDPELALHAAEAVPFGAYRVIDFLAASAPSVGEGLARVARYFPLINSGVELRLQQQPGQRAVELLSPHDPAGLPRAYVEYALCVSVLHCRQAMGVAWPLLEVRFAFARPPSTATHERLFGCGVVFGADNNALVLAEGTWEQPTAGGSSDMLRVLEGHADRLLAELRQSEGTRGTVARLLSEELRGGDPSLPRLARRMALSPRTLQRRLQAEGASFADVLDHTRKAIADVYVRDPQVALTEVAYLLGFSEPSAFSRAFQRWYGVAPSRYRAPAAGQRSRA